MQIPREPIGNQVHWLYIHHFLLDGHHGGSSTPKPSSTDISKVMTVIEAILLRTTRLQYLVSQLALFYPWYSQLSHISVLSNTAAETCTSLDLFISRNEDGIFPAINGLFRLRSLTIYVLDTREWTVFHATSWLHRTDRPLVLRTVDEFSFRVGGEVLSSMLPFLAGCRFATNCKLTLTMKGIKESDASQLIPLFVQNKIRELQLRGIHPKVQTVLAPYIVSVDTLIITKSPPTSKILKQVKVPSHVIIDAPWCKGNDNDNECFWSFLDQGQTAFLQSQCVIRILWGGSSFFSWSGGEGINEEYHAAFRQRLLPIAHKLLHQNIRVIDRTGADCTDLGLK